jgi:hypothetical protein
MEDNIEMGVRNVSCELNRTGCGLDPIWGFDASSAEPCAYFTQKISIVNKLSGWKYLLPITVKGKVVSVLFFITEYHSMKAYWGVEV